MSAEFLIDGGPAFPCDPFIASRPSTESVAKRLAEGMSLRDHFAGLALQAAISGHISHYGHESNHWSVEDIASHAYEQADAMLKARAR